MTDGMKRLAPLAALIVIATLAAWALGDVLSFDTLSRHREALLGFRDAHFAQAAVAFVAAYILIVALSLPGATVASLTGGFLFGTVTGTLFNVIAATSGAVILFLAARWGLGEKLAARMEASDGNIARIKRAIDDNQWSALFLIRLVPAVPFFAANLIPALLAVPLHRFVISTFIGILPGAAVYTSIGAGLGETFDRGESPDLGIIFEPHILLPLLGLCVLAVLPIVIKALRGQKGPTP